MLSVLDSILVLSNINSPRVLRKTPSLILINGKHHNMPRSTKSPRDQGGKKDETVKSSADETRSTTEENNVERFFQVSGSSSSQELSQYYYERSRLDYWNRSFSCLPDVTQQQYFHPYFYSAAGPIVTHNIGFFQPTFTSHGFHSSTNVLIPFINNHTIASAHSQNSSPHKNRNTANTHKRKKGRTEKMVLDSRLWEDIKNESALTGVGFVFTVMTYNVLAQDLISQHPYLYKNHNSNDLAWSKRWLNLMNEFKSISPDILCLQEVQESHLYEYYSQLQNIGYKGVFKKRTGERVDGCAIYYKTNKLTLIEYATVEYYQPNVSVLNRDNVAIIAKFSPKNNRNKQFVVATTHLLYNPRRHDVRLAQTQLLLAEIERISFKNAQERYIPIIITGDFNSSPDTPLYEFITKGQLQYEDIVNRKILVPPHLGITDSCQHAELVEKRQHNEETNRNDELALIELHNSDHTVKKTVKRSTCNPMMFCSGTLCHHFPFKSVYKHYQGDDVEGTTFQDKWHTVDYIFYSGKKEPLDKIEEDKLRLLSKYRLPTAKELDDLRIPSDCFGSDHLSLVARFKLEFS